MVKNTIGFLFLSLWFTGSAQAILFTLTIIKSPSGKMIYLFGDAHQWQPGESEVIETFMNIFQEAEKFDHKQFHVFIESSEELKPLMKKIDYDLFSELHGLVASKNFKNTSIENIEMRKLGRVWCDLFQDNEIDDLKQALEGVSNEYRKKVEKTSQRSFDETYAAVYGCSVLDVTFQDILNAIEGHKISVCRLRDQIKDKKTFDAFSGEIKERQRLIDVLFSDLQKDMTPETKLIDHALKLFYERNHERRSRLSAFGVRIWSAYFDLNLIYKILAFETSSADKVVVITGENHCLAVWSFLSDYKQLGYEIKLIRSHFREKAFPEEESRPENLQPQYYEFLKQSTIDIEWTIKKDKLSMRIAQSVPYCSFNYKNLNVQVNRKWQIIFLGTDFSLHHKVLFLR